MGVITLLVVLVALVPSLASARPVERHRAIDEEEDCLEPVPAAASVVSVTDTGDPVSLDILVLLDGVTLARGKEVIEKAAEAYAPLETTLDARFERVAFVPEDPAGDPDGIDASSSLRLLDDMKKWTFGKRPADVDLVYLLTEKDLSDAAGRADCIGGVRYAEAAFAVGEDYRYEDLAGLFYKNGTAKIAAHEIGHIMGAHHHYANCAEGIPGAVAEVGPNPCTTMFNFIDFLSLGFGTLEGPVIRGHAIDFASGGPDVEPIHSTEVALRMSGSFATGRLSSEHTGCTRSVPLRLQAYDHTVAYEEQGWSDIAAATTRPNGSFKIKMPQVPLHLRAFAAEHSFKAGGAETVCAQGAAMPVDARS